MIDASGLRVYRDHPRPDLDSLSPEEVRRLLADGDKELAVAIGTTDLGGGIISILNPLGEVVATVQSNKSNCGLIAAHDVNGDLKEALSGSR